MGFPADAAILEAVASDGEVLVRIETQKWCIVWNHSVAGFEVSDCYRFDDNRMMLMRSHQPDFAAGLGHIPGRGEQKSDSAGGYWIENIDEAVPGNCYRLRVGSPSVDHRIVAGELEISLSALASGKSIALRARQNAEEDHPAC